MVKRELAKQHLFKQLKNNVPNRSEIQVGKKIQKLRDWGLEYYERALSKKVLSMPKTRNMEVGIIISFLESNCLNLKWGEWPKRFDFKLLLFWILIREQYEGFYSDDKIFDLSDKETAKRLEAVKEAIDHKGDVAMIPLSKILDKENVKIIKELLA